VHSNNILYVPESGPGSDLLHFLAGFALSPMFVQSVNAGENWKQYLFRQTDDILWAGQKICRIAFN